MRATAWAQPLELGKSYGKARIRGTAIGVDRRHAAVAACGIRGHIRRKGRGGQAKTIAATRSSRSELFGCVVGKRKERLSVIFGSSFIGFQAANSAYSAEGPAGPSYGGHCQPHVRLSGFASRGIGPVCSLPDVWIHYDPKLADHCKSGLGLCLKVDTGRGGEFKEYAVDSRWFCFSVLWRFLPFAEMWAFVREHAPSRSVARARY